MAGKTPVIVDNGSGVSKAGFGGDEAPKVVFPSKVGVPRQHFMDGSVPGLPQLKEWYAGDEAEQKRGLLCLRYPVNKGIITNWDDMEKLWSYTFDRLNVSAQDQPILLTDVINNSKANQEKITEIMMETFQTPAMFVARQGVLSLYASGRLDGIVCDIGTEVSQIVPVSNGHAILDASVCLELGGRDLSNHLDRILTINGVTFTYQNYIKDVHEMKEKFGYVALDFRKEMEMSASDRPDLERTYKLPDEQVVTLRCERFQCPEALFQPSLFDKAFDGIHKACYDSITKCDGQVRNDLYGNIVLSGGSSMFPGLPERMEKEMKALAPESVNVKVIASPHRQYSVWIGGSILAVHSNFKDMWITKQKYEESGASATEKN